MVLSLGDVLQNLQHESARVRCSALDGICSQAFRMVWPGGASSTLFNEQVRTHIVTAVRPLLADPDECVRIGAAEVLSRQFQKGDKAGVEVMMPCLSSPSLDVQRIGIHGLGRIATKGDKEALGALIALFRTDHAAMSTCALNGASQSVRMLGIPGDKRLLSALCAKLGGNSFGRRCLLSAVKHLKPVWWKRRPARRRRC